MFSIPKMDLLFGSFTIILLFIQKTNAEIAGCDFYDTVDISTGQKFPNGSYLYDGLLIPAHLTGTYDFKVLPDDTWDVVASHVRGCVCKLRPCVRFCCSHNHLMNVGVCYDNMKKDDLESLNPYVNVTLKSGEVVKRHFKDELIVQWDLPMPCEELYYLDHTEEGNGFTMFEDATLQMHFNQMIFNKRQYCVQHLAFKDGIRIAPHYCIPSENTSNWKEVALIISLICMAITIGVYLYVKKLHDLHGKCFICYMVSLFIGYLFLLLEMWNLLQYFCAAGGFISYFFIMAAYFWLSVISLHIWTMFSGRSLKVNSCLLENRFVAYNIYSWSLAATLTAVTILANKVVVNDLWRPIVGEQKGCFFSVRNNAAMIYFYGPMLLAVIFNITMFVLTAIRIVKLRKDAKNFAQQRKKNEKINSDKQTFTFFLRLFVIMGLSWSLEIVSFLVKDNPYWSKMFQVADYINLSQGTIILVLLVLKPSTLKLIKQQIKGEYEEANNCDEEVSLGNTKFDGSVLQ
ncbi:probable G-protein coupled receptor Mth-like 3 [Drosophila eugracilis]|uniref:probable G-protein coupled receptor Mth-like 3 n=1 Tax=Drosophila eugracilis TaxID=29029 RepID=UPI0007E7066D|nr:probable G-protein coupled receptor Mth-like 3 [Drosophila eugracilis]